MIHTRWELFCKFLGALGWALLGGLLLHLQVGHWLIWFVPLVASVCVMVSVLDEVMSFAGRK